MPELQPATSSMLTIIFIRSRHIYYLSPRDDPIFPADKIVKEPSIREEYYENSLRHATVLACVDKTEWLDPAKGENGWRSLLESPNLDANDTTGIYGGYMLMHLALFNSHTYASLRVRPESSLDAQSHITEGTALRLPEIQWEVEVERLFKISLARIQIDARNIARGELVKYQEYHKESSDDFTKICRGVFLFQSQGWTNINFTWSLLALILCLFLLIMAIPAPNGNLWWESSVEYIEHLWRNFRDFLRSLLEYFASLKIYSGVKFIGSWIGKVLGIIGSMICAKQGWIILGRRVLEVFAAFPAYFKSTKKGLKAGWKMSGQVFALTTRRST